MTQPAAGSSEAKADDGSKRVRYAIDPRGSKFTVQAFAAGMLSAFAHSPTFSVRKFGGDVHYDPANPGAGALTLTIDATSLELVDDLPAFERREIIRVMRENVLEVETYPEITFASTSATVTDAGNGQFEVSLNGTLTLHGAARPQQIAAHGMATEAMLRANGEFTISQQAFGIKPVTVAGSMIKVKDELKCVFDIVARPVAA